MSQQPEGTSPPHQRPFNSSSINNGSAGPSAESNRPNNNNSSRPDPTNAASQSSHSASDPVKREETPFSLKHFLKRNPSTTTADTTTTTTASNAAAGYSITTTSSDPSSGSGTGSASVQPPRNTGTRPKVPHSTTQYPTSGGGGGTSSTSSSTTDGAGSAARMKRSPKFSSFDSQASLAEFATASPSSTSLPAAANVSHSHSSSGGLLVGRRSHGVFDNNSSSSAMMAPVDRQQHFQPASSNGDSATADHNDGDDQMHNASSSSGVFQRSFSTFDIGGGGRRYNVAGRSGGGGGSGCGSSNGAHRARNQPQNTSSLSMGHHQAIHDNDDDSDDEDASTAAAAAATAVASSQQRRRRQHLGFDDDVHHIDLDNVLDSPLRRALRASVPFCVGDSGMPDMSAGLPDFVQDHILVEHLYGASSATSSSSVAGGNDSNHNGQHVGAQRQAQMLMAHQPLPDFTQNANADDALVSSATATTTTTSVSAAQEAAGFVNMPFDLTCSPGGGCEAVAAAASAAAAASQQRRNREPATLQLNLSGLNVDGGASAAAGIRRRQRTGTNRDIPLDLTSRHEQHGLSLGFGGNNGGGSAQHNGADLYVDLAMPGGTLPDFLADGHVHASSSAAAAAHVAVGSAPEAAAAAAAPDDRSNRTTAETFGGGGGGADTADALRAENVRLRRELEYTQITLFAQQRRCEELTDAAERTAQSHSEQIRELRRRQQHIDPHRSGPAANDDAALQHQVIELTDQLEALRKENAILKEEGAVGGATRSPIFAPPAHNRFVVVQSQELSRDMLLAAASAESNLRQLLSGVDNLRLMAHRIEGLADAVADAVDDEDAVATPLSGAVDHSPPYDPADYDV